jgi:hypothetical protein
MNCMRISSASISSVTLAIYVTIASEPLFAEIQCAGMLCVKKSTGRISHLHYRILLSQSGCKRQRTNDIL